MITIEKNTTNRVVMRGLNENKTLTNSDFVFEFINDLTKDVVIFAVADTSTTCFWNEFMIEETTTIDLYNGMIELVYTGFWSYTVYEMATSSPIDLDITNAVAVLGTGKVLVKGIVAEPAAFTQASDSTPTVAFDIPD